MIWALIPTFLLGLFLGFRAGVYYTARYIRAYANDIADAIEQKVN